MKLSKIITGYCVAMLLALFLLPAQVMAEWKLSLSLNGTQMGVDPDDGVEDNFEYYYEYNRENGFPLCVYWELTENGTSDEVPFEVILYGKTANSID